MNLHSLVKGVQLSVRGAVAAGVSLALAQFFDLRYPVHSFVAAVIVTDLSPAQTRRLGWRRVVATVAGASWGAVLSQELPPGPWTIALGVLITMLACELVGITEGSRVAGYICGIVMLAHSSDAWSYAFDRLIETLLGVAVAWAIGLVPKLIRIEEPEQPDA